MKKNVNFVYISLNETNNNSSQNKYKKISSNGSIPSSKEKKGKENNFIFNKKKLNKNIIPNSNPKTYMKKINCKIEKKKNENNKYNTKNNTNTYRNLHTKKLNSDIKRKSLSLTKRNKLSPLRLATPGISTDNKKFNKKYKSKDKLNSLNKKSIKKKSIEKNNYNIKLKKISIFKDKQNCCQNGNKIVPNGKNKEEVLIYHKKIDKNNKLSWKNKIKYNFINISSDNIKKSLNYYKRNENRLNNNSLTLRNIKNNIYLNNKEMKIRNVYYPRSPTNKIIKIKNGISPLKKVNFITDNQTNNVLNDSQNIKVNNPSSSYRIFNSPENKFPNNYSYHEIVYKNSSQQNTIVKEEKKSNESFKNDNKIKESLKNISFRNNRLLLDELTTDNNKSNGISNKILMNNQGYNSFTNKNIIPYYVALTTKKYLSPERGIKEDNYINTDIICLNPNNNLNRSLNHNLFLSPHRQKLDNSTQYSEMDVENEDVQSIHFFGEEMLKKNKNYNFSKINDIYTFPINSELKRNNSLNDIKYGEIIDKKNLISSIPFSSSYNKLRLKKYQKRNENKNGEVPINKKNKRFNHNIINRKKNQKLIMEKSLNEQFIQQNNKCKSNDNTKDKISCIESSINLDNDSINEIINEFEKEIEYEEKKEQISKNSSQKKEINSYSAKNDNLVFSFLSENDNNSMSKGSTNDSKIKKNKVRYYKTKNIDMEKNCDFLISPSKLKDKKK